MRAYIVFNVGIQIEGNLVVSQVEKAFTSREGASQHLATAPQQSVQDIQTEMGPINCLCTRSVFEVEIEGDDSGRADTPAASV